MKVGISMFAGDGGKSGISQYMREIVTALINDNPDFHCQLYMTESDRMFFDPQHPRAEVKSYPDWVGQPVVNIFWHLIWLPFVLWKKRAQLVFMPAGNRRLGWFYPCQSIATVHDFSQLHVPAKYDGLRMFYILKVLPLLMRKLTRVIAISQSTQRDLENFALVERKRIRLVYNGADTSRFTPACGEHARDRLVAMGLPLTSPYILYVSRLENPGKNHLRLLEAFAAALPELDPEIKLVFAGGRWNGAEQIDQRIEELNLGERVISLGFVANEALPDLYRGALFMAFPSLFEGFGIPALEAMASGLPVMVANNSSLPEVVGEAGLTFDPFNIAQMSNQLLQLSQQPELRDALSRAGIEQAKRFSWRKSASDVYACFEQLLAKNLQPPEYHPADANVVKISTADGQSKVWHDFRFRRRR